MKSSFSIVQNRHLSLSVGEMGGTMVGRFAGPLNPPVLQRTRAKTVNYGEKSENGRT